MIFGNIYNEASYAFLPKRFKKAIEFARANDLTDVPEEKGHVIDGKRVFVNIDSFTSKPREDCQWEAHRDYADMHILYQGEELVDVTFLDHLTLGEYDADRDAQAVSGDTVQATVHLKPGDFLICYPNDAHRCNIAPAQPAFVKKGVFKVRVKEEKLYAHFQTNHGDFTVQLFADKAPITVENFVHLAESGFYDGTIFHRIIAGFMIQGGDPEGTGCGGSEHTIPDEFAPGLSFSQPGILAMANAGPNTGSSQFFVTVVPTPWLQNHHSIFGKVVKHYDTVLAISEVHTGPQDRPLEDVVLEKVTISTEL